MKFTETAFTGTTELLKFPDSYVALAVMVDDTDITANADGKKIVPKGTVVGGVSASVLADAAQKVCEKNTASVAAKLDTGVVANNNAITWTAKKAGAAGENIKIALVDPSGNDKALALSIVGDTITVSLATGPAGAITSTAASIIAAVNAHLLIKDFVSVANKGTSTGAAAVVAVEATALDGGSDGSALSAEGILLNDVDVTNGPAPGAMLLSGYIKIGKLPKAVVPEAKAALKGIFFVA